MPRRTSAKLPSPRDAEIFRRVVLRGERLLVVAQDVGLSKQRVHTICERLRQMAFQELAEDFSEHRQQTILRLEHVYREALTAWESSKAGRSSVTESTSAAGEVSRSTTRHAPVGDVRFLAEARQTLADIRELCGIDATKTEVLEIRESKTLRLEVANMTNEELEAGAALYDLVTDGALRIVDDNGGEGVENPGAKCLTLQHSSPQLP